MAEPQTLCQLYDHVKQYENECSSNQNGSGGKAIIGRYDGCFEEDIRGLCVIERIISRGLDAPAKFAPTLEVRKGNARYRRG